MRRVSDRVGFHFEGQSLEATVRDGFVDQIYVDGVEVEPTLAMVKVATTAVRRQRPQDSGGERGQ